MAPSGGAGAAGSGGIVVRREDAARGHAVGAHGAAAGSLELPFLRQCGQDIRPAWHRGRAHLLLPSRVGRGQGLEAHQAGVAARQASRLRPLGEFHPHSRQPLWRQDPLCGGLERTRPSRLRQLHGRGVHRDAEDRLCRDEKGGTGCHRPHRRLYHDAALPQHRRSAAHGEDPDAGPRLLRRSGLPRPRHIREVPRAGRSPHGVSQGTGCHCTLVGQRDRHHIHGFRRIRAGQDAAPRYSPALLAWWPSCLSLSPDQT